MNKFKFLEPCDVYKIYGIFNSKDYSNSYVCPYIDKSIYTERYIRGKMFEYKELYIGEFSKDNLKNLAVISLPSNPPFKLATADIIYMKDINISEHFLKYIVDEINSYFPGISKIRLSIEENIKSYILDKNLKKECTLEKEINNKNIEIYSYIVK